MKALEVDALLGPRLKDHLKELIEDAPRHALVYTEALVLAGLIAASYTKIHATVTYQVQHRVVFGDPNRMVKGEHHDTVTQPDSLGHRRYRGKRHRRRRTVAILGEVMFRRPDRIEAQGLGGAH